MKRSLTRVSSTRMSARVLLAWTFLLGASFLSGASLLSGVSFTSAVFAAVTVPTPVRAETPPSVSLPPPDRTGGKPLMQVLGERESARDFGPRSLPPQVLSDLLWAAAGVNRPEVGKRTVPSAMNWQNVDVYVILEQGAYLYDPREHALKGVAAGDLRKLTGRQEFVGRAPVNLVYVADTTPMKDTPPEEQLLYMGADTGFMGQDVYLFCASAGLSTVMRSSIDREPLARALGLSPDKRIVLAQTVGYPPEEQPSPGGPVH